MNTENGCEGRLKMRNDRGEFYSRTTGVRHQKTRVEGGKKDTSARDVHRNKV